MDDELQLHVRQTGTSENHFHDSDFVEHETVYRYAVGALCSDGAEGAMSQRGHHHHAGRRPSASKWSGTTYGARIKIECMEAP